MSFFALTLVLFLIMDPLGNVKSFIRYLEGLSPERERKVIFREMLIALATMVVFNFLGEYLFDLLQISKTSVYLTSGLILFLVAVKILFPASNGVELKKPIEEPFIVPLAIPMIAGPALLATIMLYADTVEETWMSVLAIFVAWAISCIILLNSQRLLRLVGMNGLTAFERMMGMVLILLSIQRMLQGVIIFMANV